MLNGKLFKTKTKFLSNLNAYKNIEIVIIKQKYFFFKCIKQIFLKNTYIDFFLCIIKIVILIFFWNFYWTDNKYAKTNRFVNVMVVKAFSF